MQVTGKATAEAVRVAGDTTPLCQFQKHVLDIPWFHVPNVSTPAIIGNYHVTFPRTDRYYSSIFEGVLLTVLRT